MKTNNYLIKYENDKVQPVTGCTTLAQAVAYAALNPTENYATNIIYNAAMQPVLLFMWIDGAVQFMHPPGEGRITTHKGGSLYEMTFKTPYGVSFTTTAPTLSSCYLARKEWLQGIINNEIIGG